MTKWHKLLSWLKATYPSAPECDDNYKYITELWEAAAATTATMPEDHYAEDIQLQHELGSVHILRNHLRGGRK